MLGEHRLFCLICILFVGFALRAYNFPDQPSVWADEASAGYESFSLLNTGRDRWGVPWPVYFTGMGPGQNALHSYLSIPLVIIFGLSPLSIRLTTLFAGTLTIPLLYVAVKRVLGERSALFSMAALAISPWQIMSSRWGLDSNEFPFFLLLGCYAVMRALGDKGVKRKIIAFLPWGLGLYSYAIGFLVVPAWLTLVTLFNVRALVKNWRSWLIAFGIFGVTAFPIALFLIKNFVTHSVLPIETFLPFGIPLLPFNRAAQVSGAVPQRWVRTFFALLSGFQEGDYRNSLVGMASILMVTVPLSLLGVMYWIKEFRRTGTTNVFLLWLAACVPMLIAFDFGVLRFSALYLPMLVAAADGLVRLGDSLSAERSAFLMVGTVGLAIFQLLVFTVDYFLVVPSQLDYQWKLSYDFGTAIRKGVALATPSEDILVTNAVDMPEMLTAFYLSYPPVRYQREEQHRQVGDIMFETTAFGRFHFGKTNYPNPSRSFVYVLLHDDKNPCAQPQTVWQTALWKVGRCEDS